MTPNSSLWPTLLATMGSTTDCREVGYIGPDGVWSNHSGSYMGGQRGQRGLDHRDFPMGIVDAIPADSPSERMMRFMQHSGAIRVDSKAGVASIVGQPTPKTLASLVVLMATAGHQTLTISRYDANLQLISSAEGILVRPDHIVKWIKKIPLDEGILKRKNVCRVS